jgi:hypothetical protein
MKCAIKCNVFCGYACMLVLCGCMMGAIPDLLGFHMDHCKNCMMGTMTAMDLLGFQYGLL